MINKSLMLLNEPFGVVAENYRLLRTNLHYMSAESGCKVIAITSSVPKEGKTTSAVNLAIAFAETNKKTLLIDGDFRQSRIHDILSLDLSPGLAHCLVDSLELKLAVHKIENLEYLDVLTAGVMPANPSELISSTKMKEIIESAREKYDYIIIDTPPILAISDALVFSKYVDGVVLAVEIKATKRSDLKKALGQLQLIGAKVYGLLATKTKGAKNSYKNYYNMSKLSK